MKYINKISGVILILLFFVSCGKEEASQRVTHTYVNFTVNLSSVDAILDGGFTYKIFKNGEGHQNEGETRGVAGVIVFNNLDEDGDGIPLVAYDLRCPYENRLDALVVPQGTEATCSVCKSKYNLINGFPNKGSLSTISLQNYCVRNVSGSSTSNKLYRVYNCN